VVRHDLLALRIGHASALGDADGDAVDGLVHLLEGDSLPRSQAINHLQLLNTYGSHLPMESTYTICGREFSWHELPAYA
jgi:hypothetical protein